MELSQFPNEILIHIVTYLNCDRSVPVLSNQFKIITELTYIPNGKDLVKSVKNRNILMIDRILRSKNKNIEQPDLVLSIWTLLFSNEHVEIAKKLLQLMDDPEKYCDELLVGLCYEGRLDIINICLDVLNIDPSKHQNRVLMCACDSGHLNIVNRLLQDPRVDPTDNNCIAVLGSYMNDQMDIYERLCQDDRVKQRMLQIIPI